MARDYMVDFVSEKYREEVVNDGNVKRIFHTIQVNSSLGSKLLILKGDDSQYRNWLRSYLNQNKRLIVRVPDMEDDEFRVSKAHGIDVTRIYSVDQEKWQTPEIGAVPGPAFTGEPHVLIVDANEKRRGLIDLIVRNLGYPVTVVANGTDALFMFRSKPSKFRMVITDSTLPGISGAQLVKNLIHTAPDLVVLLVFLSLVSTIVPLWGADSSEYERVRMSFSNFVRCELTRTNATDHFKGKPFEITMISLFDAVNEGGYPDCNRCC
jgi:hypothetical protein